MNINCPVCKNVVVQNAGVGTKKKHCSAECRVLYDMNRIRKLNCGYCKIEFEGKKGKTYCSIECRKAYNKENHKIFLLICTICNRMHESKKSSAILCSKKCREIKRKRIFECIVCKIEFESVNKNAKFCTIKCSSKHQRLVAIERAKVALPRHVFPSRRARLEYVRRKRLKENFVEKVEMPILIERDKGICQICKEPVRLDVHYLHSLAPTNDHIIPLCENGEHSYKNCQLAHRTCNNKKNKFIDYERKE